MSIILQGFEKYMNCKCKKKHNLASPDFHAYLSTTEIVGQREIIIDYGCSLGNNVRKKYLLQY